MKIILFFSFFCIILLPQQLKCNPILSSKLEESLILNGKVNLFLTMKEGTSEVLEKISHLKFTNRESRNFALKNHLKIHADKSQERLLKYLAEEKIEFKSFWVSNQIYIRGADTNLLSKLFNFDEIGEISEEEIIQLEDLESIEIKKSFSFNKDENEIEWNIKLIEADRAWNIANGSGIIVANFDTGVRGTHIALKDQFVGIEEFGWYDPVDKTPFPEDNQGHGTHTMGTICGKYGIGVAPSSKWMACAGCDRFGSCPQSRMISCSQFVICPHNTTGPTEEDKNCGTSPQLVSNSWGTSTFDWFNSAIEAMGAANITVIFSIGNTGGSGCASARYPGGYEGVIGVGAVDIDNRIASFSGRGPYRNQHLKPDISAPGVNIASAGHRDDDSYVLKSGTSMACPHISGVISLILSKFPKDNHPNFSKIKEILSNSTEKNLPPSEGNGNCGGVEENVFPNNVHGHGRVNAYEALLLK